MEILSRQKLVRVYEIDYSQGVFGKCSCGSDVMTYTDQGVRCIKKSCFKLYGVRNPSRAIKPLLVKVPKHLVHQELCLPIG